MATATEKVRSAGRVTRADPVTRVGSQARAPAPIEFLVFEDNGGRYHWKIVGGDGQTLAQSGSFQSHDEAQKAAKHVLDGAASALLGHPAPETRPPALTGPGDVKGDASDSERWLDEGGSFGSSAVAR